MMTALHAVAIILISFKRSRPGNSIYAEQLLAAFQLIGHLWLGLGQLYEFLLNLVKGKALCCGPIDFPN